MENILKAYKISVPFHMIFGLILEAITEEKNFPFKNLIETCQFLEQMVDENSTFIKDDIKEFFSLYFNHTNQEVRKQGVSLLQKYG